MIIAAQIFQRLAERFCRNQSGAVMTEYGVILALIALLVLLLTDSLGEGISELGEIVRQVMVNAGEHL